MKKIIISITLSLISLATIAQTNQYPEADGIITRSGYAYKYRNAKIFGYDTPSRVELFNASNTYLNVTWGYKDGTDMPADKALGRSDKLDFSSSSLTIAQTYAVVAGCFTNQQKSALIGKAMIIECRINPSTGKIEDVYFDFFRNYPFANIPVETYRSVELALKQNLTVTVTAEGQKLNYIQLYWSQKF